jgi:protein-S-isoprenylcysteine O-methyltransferase Ste14
MRAHVSYGGENESVRAAVGSLVFLVVAPGVVAGLIPWWITRWRVEEPLQHWAPLRVVGLILLVAGAVVLLDAFRRFVVEGVGTPAPLAPTKRLVVGGLYRYVRNPMYVAVAAVILGQALIFASGGLFAYLVVIGVAQGAFVRIYEEPTLREAYGPSYEEFCDNVPCWLPRLTPWRGATRRPGDRMHRSV